jgi:Xaa-Pro dipeptidase
MVVTVEPGIYLEGDFGVRIEDTILVDNKGKIIGNLPQKL